MNLDGQVKNRFNVSEILKKLLVRLSILEKNTGGVPPVPSLDEVTAIDNNILEKDVIINSAMDDKGVIIYRDAFNNTRITKSRIYSYISGVLYQYVFPQTSGELVTDVPNNNGIYTRKYREWIMLPKVYRALLTQIGTDAPTVIVLENTLGFVPVWQRDSPGGYYISNTGSFPTNKTYISALRNSAIYDLNAYAPDGDSVWLEATQIVSLGPLNVGPIENVMTNISIEIIVYN